MKCRKAQKKLSASDIGRGTRWIYRSRKELRGMRTIYQKNKRQVAPMKRGNSVTLIILFLISGLAFAAQKEKIAVVADDKTPAASVGSQAGRSPFFFFFDAYSDECDHLIRRNLAGYSD